MTPFEWFSRLLAGTFVALFLLGGLSVLAARLFGPNVIVVFYAVLLLVFSFFASLVFVSLIEAGRYKD